MPFSTFSAHPSTNNDIALLPLYISHPSTSFQSAPKTPAVLPARPSNMTSKPPPILQSDALLNLSRQEAHLQSNLQHLLDAQSEGLLAGLAGGPPHDDGSSNGSRTPTTESEFRFQKSQPVVPVRQPTKKKLGLRGARRGIARAIADLADLKGEEGRVIEDEVTQRDHILSTVDGYAKKSTGLREQIRGIESEESSQRVQALKVEEKALGDDIHDLETKLYEMKAHHRHLLREIDGLSNSVQSKLSSYESALALAEKDIRKYLGRPPIESSTSGLWALPKERRTLEMAKEYYTEEQQSLQTHLVAVQSETSALEEGSLAWEEVIREVNGVETALRQEMQQMQTPLLDTGSDPAATGMKKILQTMRKARSRIQVKLEHAETHNWRLLVCCIGAELEALVEGQAILEGALEASQETKGLGEEHGLGEVGERNGTTVAEGSLIDDGSAPVVSLRDKSLPARGYLDRSEDEDDGPGPELLISQHGD